MKWKSILSFPTTPQEKDSTLPRWECSLPCKSYLGNVNQKKKTNGQKNKHPKQLRRESYGDPKEGASTTWNNSLRREVAPLSPLDPHEEEKDPIHHSQTQPPFLAMGISTWMSLSSLKRENLSAIFLLFASILRDCDKDGPYVRAQ